MAGMEIIRREAVWSQLGLFSMQIANLAFGHVKHVPPNKNLPTVIPPPLPISRNLTLVHSGL